MRRLLALLFPLLGLAQTPAINSLTAVNSATDKGNLLTVGGEQLSLRGTNFGAVGAQLTYIGPSPFQNGFTVRYTPLVQFQNDTVILFTTTPGIGGNLQFTIVRQANNASFTSPPLASYSIPSITNISGVGAVNPTALRPQGGDTIRIFGRNFGPRTYPGYPSIYTPWVRFGGVPGTWAWMQGCSRTTVDFDSVITCRTPVGGGTNHTVRVQSGYSGHWSIVDRNKTVTFMTPTLLSTTPTFGAMTTSGGDQIVIRGLNMPYPSWVIQGFCPVSASFGPNTTAPPFRYRMNSCTGAFDGDGRTPVITCLTPEGTGRGFSLTTVVGGVSTNTLNLPASSAGYAPPVIYDFAGANQGASTLGNQTIFVNGRNFGRNASLVSARYTLNLKGGLAPTSEASLNYTYISPACNVTIPHLQLGCLTAPGVGQDLIWAVTVDGQDNINPKTSYAPPIIDRYEIRNATSLVPKAAAATAGGDLLYVYGSGFGSTSLDFLKDLIAVSPFGLTIPLANYTIRNDGLLAVSLPPGGGSGWSLRFKVADVSTEPSAANYSYANPTVTGLAPATGPTAGGTTITVFAEDLATSNPVLLTGVLFGNPDDGSLHPTVIPAALVPRPDNDTSTRAAFLPGRVTFRLPAGAGLGRAVRLVTYLETDTPPDPGTVPLQPTSIRFNYADPVIENAVLSQPTTPEQIQEALNFFGPDAVAASAVRLLTLYGTNFGSSSAALSTRRIQFQNGTSEWLNTSGVYAFDLAEWTESLLSVYTLQTVGQVRLALGSLDLDGITEYFQYSNSFTYNDFSPSLATNSTGPFPTVGGTTLSVMASYLAAATGFNITVGGVAAEILDPTTGAPLVPGQIYSRILTNPAVYSPPGPFTPSTTWQIPIRIPPGQGSQVPVQIIRTPDGAASAPSFLGYVAPSLTAVNGQPYDPYRRLFAPTPGTQFTFSGANFGPNPIVRVATYSLSTRPSADHTQITIQVPEGEGDGQDLLGTAAGWTIEIVVGDQSTPLVLFGWLGPEITQIVHGPLPTLGGASLTLNGANFGASVPGYPQASLPAQLQVQVILNSTYRVTASTLCQSPLRISHTQILCTTPAAAGTFQVFVSVTGRVSSSSQQITYNPPGLRENGTATNVTTGLASGNVFILNGTDLGPSAENSCVFFTNRYATATPICNGQEDFAGEGEQPAGAFLSWSHTQIIVVVPLGTGSPRIRVSVWGAAAELEGVFSYPPPHLFNLSASSGPAAGGYPVTLWTSGVGAAPTSAPYPRPLPATFFSPIQIFMNGLCLSSAPVPGCRQVVLSYEDSAATFLMPEGVGANYSFVVAIYDPLVPVRSESHILWSYDPPEITQLGPNPVYVGVDRAPTTVIQGLGLGTAQAFLNFPDADKGVVVYVDGREAPGQPTRISTETLDVGIQFTVDGVSLTAGSKTLRFVVAGQTGELRNTSFSALKIFCEKDFFAREGELCIGCPVGGDCPGGLQYPAATAGFFNLNSSYPDAEGCPASVVLRNADGSVRDVCVVACSPSEACVGLNRCATGYRSVAPAYRCNVCERGYFKRAAECVRCPDSPAAVIIVCLFVVIGLAVLGYILNTYRVNMAFLSIAIDYFQVISIFLQSNVAWPPVIKNIMYVLSAFNLNLDIVAPECLVPEVSYSQKFYFIQTLPIALFGFLLLVNLSYVAYKAFVLGRSKKELWRHVSSVKAAAVVIMYFLYLYVTRTLLDVFNCAPTVPPTYDANGNVIRYLSAQFEVCGKPGGLQMTLMPVAVLGLLGYSVGFPAFIAWVMIRHKITIMFDQLLRAQDEGDSRFENPVAYETRKAYGRLYYQYKPDFYAWSLMILGRKFCIAVTTVMFVTNAAFQMAACLLILFVGFAAQMRFNPFMCYDDYDNVVQSHLDAVPWSQAHMRVNAMLLALSAQNRQRRKVRRNVIMDLSGKIDRTALFEAMGSWIFNYNTVEATMLFCGVMICLMGVMYQAQTGHDGGRDIITGVILFIIVCSILYLFSVFCVEVYLAVGKHKKFHTLKIHGVSSRRIEAAEPVESKTETNPMMLSTRISGQINIDEYDEPPPAALWPLFKQTFKKNKEAVTAATAEVAALKKEKQGVEMELGSVLPVRLLRREMAPVKSKQASS